MHAPCRVLRPEIVAPCDGKAQPPRKRRFTNLRLRNHRRNCASGQDTVQNPIGGNVSAGKKLAQADETEAAIRNLHASRRPLEVFLQFLLISLPFGPNILLQLLPVRRG